MGLLKQLYQIWLKFAHTIGKVNTLILLTLFYIVFIGLTRIFVWLFQKDLLDLRRSPGVSYWKKREDFTASREAFLKPY